MTPQISAVNMRSLRVKPFPSRTYRLGESNIAGFVDGLEAVKQAVFHILSTERYAYSIYDDNYGVELEQFIGASLPYIEANIYAVIRDALMQDDRIVGVSVDGVTQTDHNSVLIEITVNSSLGTFGTEVSISA